MYNLNTVQKITVWILPLLFAITLHEVAHGWVAYWRGDGTAKMMNRLSLNPLRHIDLFGTIILPIALLFTSGFLFGYAKPVPINTRYFKHPRLDEALVAFAGPLANLIMAFMWAGFSHISMYIPGQAGLFCLLMSRAGVAINIMLFVLNLLPIPPLDGGHILMCIMPANIAYHLKKFESYGFLVLLLLLFTGILNAILLPPIGALLSLFQNSLLI